MATPDPLRSPSPFGCVAATLWLVLLVFSVFLFIGGYQAISLENDDPRVAEFGWWLVIAGAACVAILISSLVIIMRIRRGLGDEDDSSDTPQEG